MKSKVVRFVLVILTLGLFLSCLPVSQPLPLEVPTEIIESHVVVGNVCIGQDGLSSMGTNGAGVIIGHKKNRTYILTASHATYLQEPVIGYTFKLGVWIHETTNPIDTEIEELSLNGLDAAIISTKSINRRAAKISRRDPKRGERVFVFGSPLGEFREVRRRGVSEFGDERIRSKFRSYPTRFVLDGSIVHGFSGGGVFNRHKELVGMCHAVRPEENNRGVCIPIRTLADSIQLYR